MSTRYAGAWAYDHTRTSSHRILLEVIFRRILALALAVCLQTCGGKQNRSQKARILHNPRVYSTSLCYWWSFAKWLTLLNSTPQKFEPLPIWRVTELGDSHVSFATNKTWLLSFHLLIILLGLEYIHIDCPHNREVTAVVQYIDLANYILQRLIMKNESYHLWTCKLSIQTQCCTFLFITKIFYWIETVWLRRELFPKGLAHQ